MVGGGWEAGVFDLGVKVPVPAFNRQSNYFIIFVSCIFMQSA